MHLRGTEPKGNPQSGQDIPAEAFDKGTISLFVVVITTRASSTNRVAGYSLIRSSMTRKLTRSPCSSTHLGLGDETRLSRRLVWSVELGIAAVRASDPRSTRRSVFLVG
jgi:hypothetical protein